VHISQNIISQLANRDPVLGKGFWVLGVQGDLATETIESQRNKLRNESINSAVRVEKVSEVKEERENRDY